MWTLVILVFLVLLAFYTFRWFIDARRHRLRQTLSQKYDLVSTGRLVAFFHPFCTSRGGGERVLWACINSMQSNRSKPVIVVIYTCDPECVHNRTHVLKTIQQTFDVRLDDIQPQRGRPGGTFALHFVLLRSTRLLSPSLYPVLTLFGQALGSLIVGLEAMLRCPPDIYLDTTGFAFTLPLAKRVFRAKTGAYVHYPTVSSDMIDRVSASLNRTGTVNDQVALVSYNNARWIRDSRVLSLIKLAYYRVLVETYRWVGSPTNVDCVMTNSTWTYNHIRGLWGGNPTVLYPPCPTEDMSPGDCSVERKPWIVSVGQFRPEKDHELQIEAFARFLTRCNLSTQPDAHPYRLLLIGGCRDHVDSARVNRLRELARSRGLQDLVQFHVNVPYATLKQHFHQSMINLHTMVDEHFGICVVEGMAAGLITVAHDSGGPRTDIIGPAMARLPEADSGGDDKKQPVSAGSGEAHRSSVGVGFLARTADQYARVFEHVLMRMSEADRMEMRQAAQLWVRDKFSESCFTRGWLENIRCLDL